MKSALLVLLPLASALVPAVPRSVKTVLNAAPVAEAPAAPADLTNRIPDCPVTAWNDEGLDLAAERNKDFATKTCPLEWQAAKGDEGVDYFKAHQDEIHARLLEHGCIWFRGFDLMKKEGGFRSMYEAIDLDPCLDPIHTSGLRKFASQSDAIYDEVNKPSLAQHYIGLHQESTHKKTAKFGAFVCFQPASESGGEFLIADAAKIARDLDIDVAQRMYDRKIRISVSNLDLDFLGAIPQFKQGLLDGARDLVDKLVAPKFDMDLEMVYGADGKPMRLQAIEQIASPFNRHPETGQPLWFCNVHNHARYLRDNRPCTVPEIGMTEVYHGDLSAIAESDLDHIDAVSRANIARLAMQPGDVVLVDNYRVLHGRDIFKGDRYHAVAWFGGRRSERPGEDMEAAKPGNVMNKLINKFLVDSF